MLAHLLNNGLQIILIYVGGQNKTLKNIVDGNQLPWQIIVAGIVLFAVSFYMLWKKRTPLSENWSDDFAGEKREDNFTQV